MTSEFAVFAKNSDEALRTREPPEYPRLIVRPTQNQGQEAPRPLFRELPPATPFPVDALGKTLTPAAMAIQSITQCPTAIAAQSVLAAASLAVQSHSDVVIPATGRAKPTSLFLVTVAGTGERKSAADFEALLPVARRERELRETYEFELPIYKNAKAAWDAARKKAEQSGKGNYQAIKDALDAMPTEPQAPLNPVLTCGEPTIEGLQKLFANGQPALGLFSDEGGSFLNGHGLSDENRLRTIAGLSQIWDGTPIKRVRAGDGASVFPGRRLSMHLMAQPDVAARLLCDPVMKDQGFLSRILVAAPDSTAGTRFQRKANPADQQTIEQYAGKLFSILSQMPQLSQGTRNELEPRKLVFDAEAVAAWSIYADDVERRLVPGQPFEQIRGLANKLPEHAARLAAVLTLVDDTDALAINLDMLERGILLAEFYASEAMRMFDAGHGSPDLRQAETLRIWLQDKWQEPFVSVRAIVRLGPNSIRSTNTAKAAIAILLDHGWLTLEGRGTVEGQPVREAYRVVYEGSV